MIKNVYKFIYCKLNVPIFLFIILNLYLIIFPVSFLVFSFPIPFLIVNEIFFPTPEHFFFQNHEQLFWLHEFFNLFEPVDIFLNLVNDFLNPVNIYLNSWGFFESPNICFEQMNIL
jgi:hypothetical protein